MTIPIPTPPPPPHSDLPRKLAVLFLLAMAAALGIVLLFRVGYPTAYLNLLLLDSGLLGLVTGFGARFVLKKRSAGMRLLTAFATLIVGLTVLGFFTNWQFGFSLYFLRGGRFDWAGLIQLVFGMLAAALALFAWRRPEPVIVTSLAEQEPPTEPTVIVADPEPLPAPTRVKTPRARLSTTGKKPRTSTSSKPRTRTKVQSGAQTKAKSAASTSKRRTRKADVQFANAEEHRCPYCLELVQPNDPRGVVECDICHALHHADCWAITGACQVPHLNS